MEFKGDATLLSEGTVIVDFFATWCGPCKSIAPVFAQLAEDAAEANSAVTFLKVDVDEFPKIAAKYDVESMPTFLVLVNGKVQERLEGADVQKLKKMVKTRVGKN